MSVTRRDVLAGTAAIVAAAATPAPPGEPVPTVNPVIRSKLTHLFVMLDLDRDGVIVSDDLQRIADEAAWMHGLEPDTVRHTDLIDSFSRLHYHLRADLSSTDPVTLDVWLRVCQTEAFLAALRVHAERWFTALDVGDTGLWFPIDLWTMLSSFGVTDSRHVYTWFRQLDVEETGYIRRAELEDALLGFFTDTRALVLSTFLFGPVDGIGI